MSLAAISAGIGLVKSGIGIYQMLSNKEPERPTYTMPSELNQILGISRFLTSQRGLPGQNLIERKLASNTAANVKAIQETSTGGAGLGAVNDAFGNQQKATTNLEIAGANAYQNNLAGLQQSLDIVANAKDQEFEYNQNMPYQRALQNYYQTRQSGATNMFGGVQDIVGAAGIASNEKQINKWMDMLYGNGQQQTGQGIPASPQYNYNNQPNIPYMQPQQQGDWRSMLYGMLFPQQQQQVTPGTINYQ